MSPKGALDLTRESEYAAEDVAPIETAVWDIRFPLRHFLQRLNGVF